MRLIKTGFALILIAVLSAAAAPASADNLLGRPSETASLPGVHGVALGILAIRNGPGKAHAKLGEFPKGSALVFLGPPGCAYGYCFVQGPNGVRGWILKEATKITSTGSTTRSDIVGFGISQKKLHLRSGPSEYDNSLGILAVGETMHMLKSPPCRNGYCYVETSRGQRGWVLRSVISIHGFD